MDYGAFLSETIKRFKEERDGPVRAAFVVQPPDGDLYTAYGQDEIPTMAILLVAAEKLGETIGKGLVWTIVDKPAAD